MPGGRPRKPLSLQKGDLRVVNVQRMRMEEEIAHARDTALDRPPAWLKGKIQRQTWKWAVENMRVTGMTADADLQALARYCEHMAQYRELMVFRQKNGFLGDKQFDQLMKLDEKLTKYESSHGLDWNSRLKAASVKVKDQQETLEAKFGAI